MTKHTGHDIICDNCGKQFYIRGYHINRQKHQFCSLNCQKEYIHKERFEIRKCEICNVEFECSKLSTQRFCSPECNSEWQKTLVGELNYHFTSKKIECDYCGKPFYIKPCLLETNKHHFCSKKCRQDWYANVFSQTKECKERSRANIIKTIEKCAMNNTNSKPQQIVDSLLDKNNIVYQKEKGIVYFNVDNYLEDDLMVEVQGDYWHCNPNKFDKKITKQQFDRISRDKAKHTYIVNNYNKEPLYIWECDTYKRKSLCENDSFEWKDG